MCEEYLLRVFKWIFMRVDQDDKDRFMVSIGKEEFCE